MSESDDVFFQSNYSRECDNKIEHAINAVPIEIGLIIYRVIREKGQIVDWEIRDVNAKVLRDFGMPMEYFIGRRATDIYRENPNLDALIQVSNDVISEGKHYRFEMRLPFNNRSFLMGLYPWDENTLIHTGIDQTELRETEEALRNSEDKLTLALEVSQMVSWEWNIAGRYINYSERCKDLFGLKQYFPMSFKEFMNMVHPEDRNHVRRSLAEALKMRRNFNAEMRIVLPDQTVRWGLSMGRGIYDSSGKPIQMIGMIMDITERKSVEESLRIANERLIEADRQKDDFLAILSHELRNPLASIRNSLYLLENWVPSEKAKPKGLEIINRQVDYLCRLVDDLLDVTRIQKNRMKLALEEVNLNDLIRRTLEDYEVLFTKNDIRLYADYGTTMLYVRADTTRLAQVIGNLLHNAAKFTDRGGEVRVSLALDSSQAVIEIKDTGIGMAQETMDRLFHPFIQADLSVARSKGGLGLGLALAKELVLLHHGSITAQSEGLGKGSQFIIRLPLCCENTPQNKPEGDPPQAQVKVLLIEDNRDVAASLGELLQLMDYEVFVASGGEEGLATARAVHPHVLLCDIGLPGMDGYAVAENFRKDPELKKMYLVALTGYALPEDIRRAKEAGFDCHLAKPLTLAELQKVLSLGQGG